MESTGRRIYQRRQSVGRLSGTAVLGVLDETLSGTLFRASPHVTLRPLVAEMQIGISARLKLATFSYIVHQTGAEYTTRTTAHQWSSLQAAWEFGR